ncbi:MAG: DUF4397 domain-containing protein [Lachnospiraceae bacterium]|nr:DUF4397 domain-containing protein [Lachnospiraceae bacterium]MBQ6994297.1 DUF4397 domain-containing protein [Lachnospiraceae bacterium]
MDSRNANDGNPSIPLPNPGEGGAVYPGMTEDNMQNNSATPVIPLPNPGEGGAAFPGTGRPQGGNAGNIGGTVLPNIIGTIISTYPRPNEPCRFCSPTNPRAGYARFLNAATGYNPFVVFLNENMFSSSLNFAEVTAYERVGRGTQVVTIMGENGYIFVQKQVEFRNDEYVTIVIINTESGLDIQVISDNGCDRGSNMACVRAANFAYNSGPLTVTIGNQYLTFPNLRYQDVADFESAWPGLYVYTVTRNMNARFPGMGVNVLLTAAVNLQKNRNYTMYLLNWKRDSSDSIKVLIVEDL